MPNFLIIGANKAGTTSLYRYLEQHPDVYMSPVKEPAYFAPIMRMRAGDSPRLPQTLEEYTALFDGVEGETAIGEASTAYLPNDHAADLIREAIPHVRLVAILRNPLDRAFSAYGMHVAWGDEDLSFGDAIAAELENASAGLTWKRRYVQFGFYGRHLSRYLRLFDREQIRIYLYDDLRRDPEPLVRDLFGFVGVVSSFSPETAERHNVTRHPPRSKTLERMSQWRPAKATAKRVLPSATLTRVKEYVRRKNSVKPAFPPEVRQRLIDVYRDDVALVEKLIDRDLSSWLA